MSIIMNGGVDASEFTSTLGIFPDRDNQGFAWKAHLKAAPAKAYKFYNKARSEWYEQIVNTSGFVAKFDGVKNTDDSYISSGELIIHFW